MPTEFETIWQANAGPQAAALACPLKDLFYGGARGGGKTDFLLADWASHASKYGDKATGVIFRKSFPQLDDIIMRTRQLYTPLGAVYNSTNHVWKMPTGAELRIRFLDSDADANEYHGHSYTWIGFDELTNWPTSTGVDRLFATLRSGAGVPVFRRSTGNPGGPGHNWVHERYIEPSEPLKPFRWKPQPVLLPKVEIESVFIPARIEDNPKLPDDYEVNVAASVVGDPELFKAWRYGLWDILRGSYFKSWGPQCVAAHEEFPWWWPRFVSWDWGFAHDSAILWHATDGKTIYTYREMLVQEKTPDELAHEIVQRSRGENVDAIYLSHEVFGRKYSSETMASAVNKVFGSYGWPNVTRADTDRVGGWQLMNQRMGDGSWKITTNCPNLIKKIPTATRNEKDPEDIVKHEGDDILDSARYGIKGRQKPPEKPYAVRLAERLPNTPDVVGYQSYSMSYRRAASDLAKENVEFASMRRAG